MKADPGLHEVRWWQLPSILGLDAPTVVILWLALFADSFEKAVPTSVFGAAFFAVWSIYLADRLLDVKTCRDWENATVRLKFGRHFQPFFAGLLAISLGTGVWLVFAGKIPPDVLMRTVWVGTGVFCYFAAFVLPPFFRKRKWPGKEFGVGLFFVGGIFAATGFEPGMLPAFIGVALLITFNCLLIASRDHGEDAANDPGGASRWWLSLNRDLRIAGFLLSGISLITSTIRVHFIPTPSWTIFGCMAISFYSMTVLHSQSRNISGGSVRALADFCLLSPIIVIAVTL